MNDLFRGIVKHGDRVVALPNATVRGCALSECVVGPLKSDLIGGIGLQGDEVVTLSLVGIESSRNVKGESLVVIVNEESFCCPSDRGIIGGLLGDQILPCSLAECFLLGIELSGLDVVFILEESQTGDATIISGECLPVGELNNESFSFSTLNNGETHSQVCRSVTLNLIVGDRQGFVIQTDSSLQGWHTIDNC